MVYGSRFRVLGYDLGFLNFGLRVWDFRILGSRAYGCVLGFEIFGLELQFLIIFRFYGLGCSIYILRFRIYVFPI